MTAERAPVALPAWLQTKEESNSLDLHEGRRNKRGTRGKDRFIDKTILALLGLVSAIRAQDVREDVQRDERNHRNNHFYVDAFWRLLCTIVLIVLLSLTRDFAFVFAVLTCLLLRICAMPLADLRKVALVAVLAGFFSFVIMAPSVLGGSRYSLTMIPAKTVASVLAVGILSRTSRSTEIVHALRRVRVPGLLIFIVDIALKYIFMLGEFTLESMRALKLRSVGANRGGYSSIAGIAGNLFIRSRSMAEMMHGAMRCRGFSGTYPVSRRLQFAVADMCYIAAHLALIALFLCM